MNPANIKMCKQRCQDLCRKVHDHAQSFVLRSWTSHELRNKNVYIMFISESVANDYCALWTVNAKKTYNKELGQV